jgi:hypothetical protein
MLLASFFRYLDPPRPRTRPALQRSGWGRLFLERLETRVVPGFIAPLSFDAGNEPSSVAVGDFNGDGIPDLAVANRYSNTVSVLLGHGDGTFGPAVSYAAGSYPDAVAVGDFTGNGVADLAVGNFNNATVSVLLGNGDGSFQPAVNYAAGGTPFWLAVGDFTGDGTLDLVTANKNSATVSVLLGHGDGTFRPAVNYAVGGTAVSVTVGDFQGDGVADLAVANDGNIIGQHIGVSVLLGHGDGTFGAAVSYPAGSYPNDVAVGDFNGDGVPDLAVTNFATNGPVDALLGNGDGSFQPAVSYAAGFEPLTLAVGDFNGDGHTDLAVANYSGPDTVSVLLGNGDGSFQPAASYPAGTLPNSVAVGDFNGDGVADLVVANDASPGTVSVLLGKGDGSFPVVPRYHTGTNPESVAVGDFNGDGIPDLAVANHGDEYGQGGGVSVRLGNGDGIFQPAHSFAAGVGPSTVGVADVNGDGIPDLVVADSGDYLGRSGGVSVLLGNGNGTFQPARTFAAAGAPHSVAVGDFNGDGVLDLAVDNGVYDTVSILLGNGDGTFQPAVTYAAGTNPDSVAVGDFDGDGTPDLVVANAGDVNGNGAGVSMLLGNGDGTFQPARTVPAGRFPQCVAVGDFNGDGKRDLAVANAGTQPDYPDGSVSVLLGNGDGTFRPAVNYPLGLGPDALAVGDFNGDQIPDLAVVNEAGNVSVLVGNGDGSFQARPGYYAAAFVSNSLAVGDFNSDGKPDLAVADYEENSVAILFNDGTWAARPGGQLQPRRPGSEDERALLSPVSAPTGFSPPESAPPPPDTSASPRDSGPAEPALGSVDQSFADAPAPPHLLAWSRSRVLARSQIEDWLTASGLSLNGSRIGPIGIGDPIDKGDGGR